jgi:phosphatidylglycerophosphatase A
MQYPTDNFASRIAKIIASFFFVGFIPVVPGTFGSLATFVLYFLLRPVGYWQVYLGAIILVIALGIWAAGRAELDSKIVDPSFVVIDEVAGQLITLFLIPFSWLTLVAGFVIFRALDIIKPAPARQAERLHGGWGIMMDDVLAGIYGNLFLHLCVFVYHRIFA